MMYNKNQSQVTSGKVESTQRGYSPSTLPETSSTDRDARGFHAPPESVPKKSLSRQPSSARLVKSSYGQNEAPTPRHVPQESTKSRHSSDEFSERRFAPPEQKFEPLARPERQYSPVSEPVPRGPFQADSRTYNAEYSPAREPAPRAPVQHTERQYSPVKESTPRVPVVTERQYSPVREPAPRVQHNVERQYSPVTEPAPRVSQNTERQYSPVTEPTPRGVPVSSERQFSPVSESIPRGPFQAPNSESRQYSEPKYVEPPQQRVEARQEFAQRPVQYSPVTENLPPIPRAEVPRQQLNTVAENQRSGYFDSSQRPAQKNVPQPVRQYSSASDNRQFNPPEPQRQNYEQRPPPSGQYPVEQKPVRPIDNQNIVPRPLSRETSSLEPKSIPQKPHSNVVRTLSREPSSSDLSRQKVIPQKPVENFVRPLSREHSFTDLSRPKAVQSKPVENTPRPLSREDSFTELSRQREAPRPLSRETSSSELILRQVQRDIPRPLSREGTTADLITRPRPSSREGTTADIPRQVQREAPRPLSREGSSAELISRQNPREIQRPLSRESVTADPIPRQVQREAPRPLSRENSSVESIPRQNPREIQRPLSRESVTADPIPRQIQREVPRPLSRENSSVESISRQNPREVPRPLSRETSSSELTSRPIQPRPLSRETSSVELPRQTQREYSPRPQEVNSVDLIQRPPLPRQAVDYVTENRPIQRTSEVDRQRENLSESRSIPPRGETLIDRSRPIDQTTDRPRQIDPTADRPLARQPSTTQLPYRPPQQQGGEPPKTSFRQLVTRQLIPPRTAEVNRNDTINPHHGMGIEQSRYRIPQEEDPNRLIKLARSEMADPRPDIMTHERMSTDRPMRVEPPRKIPEVLKPQQQLFSETPPTSIRPPSAEPSNDNVKVDSTGKEGPKIMPSGKPVAKEVTITVSGKLPSTSQPSSLTRGKPEETRDRVTPDNRPPPIKKPQESAGRYGETADMLKRAESFGDGQRRVPEGERSMGDSYHDQVQRIDSAGNMVPERRGPVETNYRRPEEYGESGRPNSGNSKRGGYSPDIISETGRMLNEEKLFESNRTAPVARPGEYKRMDYANFNKKTPESEKILTSLSYILPDSKPVTFPSPGGTSNNGYKHESENKQRPSELNLSGTSPERKLSGRVGWKSSDENRVPERKISGRSTPVDKGVSFVETPRKKPSDTKVPGTWCALTGRFIPFPFERPKSPDPRPKTPTTPRKKKFIGSYCAKTGRYIPPEKEVEVTTPRTPDGRKTPEFKLSGSGRSTPDTARRGRASTPRDGHVSFMDGRRTPEDGRKTSESGRTTPSYGRRTPKKPHIAFGSVVPDYHPPERRRIRRTKSNDWADRRGRSDGDHDSGVDDLTQGHPTANGEVKGGAAAQTRRAPASKIPAHKRASTPGTGPGSPASSPMKSPNKPHPPRSASLTPEPTAERKKVPMNKVQVGMAASPNLKAVRSKIGSLENTTHKPGGGQVRIESRKVDFSHAKPRTAAKNEQYQPGGGDKKIESQKLQWTAKSKIGSLENATHKAGGGEKKIESQKLDFKDKAKSKVGSKDNIKHQPGGGQVKILDMKADGSTPGQSIDNNKLDFKEKVTSKVGSLANVTHKPGGGDVKIFDDKEYLKQMQGTTPVPAGSTGTHSKASSEGQQSGNQSPMPTSPPPGILQNASPLSPTPARS